MIRKEFYNVSSSHTDEIRHIVIEFVNLSLHDFRLIRMLGDGMIVLHGNRQL